MSEDVNPLLDDGTEAELPDGSAAELPTEELDTETVLLQQLAEYKQAAQRATADYRNLQRDTDQRLGDMRKYATEELLVELCPAIDYFDSAFTAIPEEQKSAAWVVGIKHIQDYILQVLKAHNVERMTTAGQLFNPEYHEAMGEEVSELPDQTIVKEIQAGFLMNGKVIRHAKVIISKK